MIPLSEPALQGRELEYVTDCLRSGWISSNGEYVVRFEEALADYVGVRARRGLQLRDLGPPRLADPVGRRAPTTRSSCRR